MASLDDPGQQAPSHLRTLQKAPSRPARSSPYRLHKARAGSIALLSGDVSSFFSAAQARLSTYVHAKHSHCLPSFLRFHVQRFPWFRPPRFHFSWAARIIRILRRNTLRMTPFRADNLADNC